MQAQIEKFKLVVDPLAKEAAYQQIHAQIALATQAGDLPCGTRLPSVRKLASELGLAPNTVAKAIKSLESAGIVITKGRHGTFIAAVSEVIDEVHESANDFTLKALKAGMEPDAIHLLVDAIINKHL